MPDFDELVNDIMDEIRLRFDGLTAELRKHASGWPLAWEYTSEDRDTFVRTVRRFSSNYAPAFGTLLTPLVDGIRIQGPFFPAFMDRRPRLILLDGEGLGHVGDPAAGVASRIARRFTDVDVILLVNSAKAPMLEAPASVLRAVAASGPRKSSRSLSRISISCADRRTCRPSRRSARTSFRRSTRSSRVCAKSSEFPPCARLSARLTSAVSCSVFSIALSPKRIAARSLK